MFDVFHPRPRYNNIMTNGPNEQVRLLLKVVRQKRSDFNMQRRQRKVHNKGQNERRERYPRRPAAPERRKGTVMCCPALLLGAVWGVRKAEPDRTSGG